MSDGCLCRPVPLRASTPSLVKHTALAERRVLPGAARPGVTAPLRAWPRCSGFRRPGAPDACIPRLSRRRSSLSSTTGSSPTSCIRSRAAKKPRSSAVAAAPRLDYQVWSPPRSTSRATFRSFRDDAVYREGRVILDKRAARAVAKRTSFGQKSGRRCGPNHEWDTLPHAARGRRRRAAPLAHSSGAILIEFVGDADGAAPMLKTSISAAEEAEAVFERCSTTSSSGWPATSSTATSRRSTSCITPRPPGGHRLPAGVRPALQHQRVHVAACATSRTWRATSRDSASSATRSRWPSATGRSGSGRRYASARPGSCAWSRVELVWHATRQVQFRSGAPGVFMRASLPRSSRSCSGTIAVWRSTGSARRIRSSAMREPSVPR